MSEWTQSKASRVQNKSVSLFHSLSSTLLSVNTTHQTDDTLHVRCGWWVVRCGARCGARCGKRRGEICCATSTCMYVRCPKMKARSLEFEGVEGRPAGPAVTKRKRTTTTATTCLEVMYSLLTGTIAHCLSCSCCDAGVADDLLACLFGPI